MVHRQALHLAVTIDTPVPIMRFHLLPLGRSEIVNDRSLLACLPSSVFCIDFVFVRLPILALRLFNLFLMGISIRFPRPFDLFWMDSFVFCHIQQALISMFKMIGSIVGACVFLVRQTICCSSLTDFCLMGCGVGASYRQFLFTFCPIVSPAQIFALVWHGSTPLVVPDGVCMATGRVSSFHVANASHTRRKYSTKTEVRA